MVGETYPAGGHRRLLTIAGQVTNKPDGFGCRDSAMSTVFLLGFGIVFFCTVAEYLGKAIRNRHLVPPERLVLLGGTVGPQRALATVTLRQAGRRNRF